MVYTKKSPITRKKPIQREYHEMRLIHDFLTIRNIPHFHCPNESGGNFARGALNKKIGVSSGVPDLFIFIPPEKNTHNIPLNFAIEVKEPSRKNKPSKSQLSWLSTLNSHGFITYVAYGFTDFRDFLYSNGLKPTTPENTPF